MKPSKSPHHHLILTFEHLGPPQHRLQLVWSVVGLLSRTVAPQLSCSDDDNGGVDECDDDGGHDDRGHGFQPEPGQLVHRWCL